MATVPSALLGAVFALTVAWAAAAAGSDTVALVLSARTPAHEAVSGAIRAQLPPRVPVVEWLADESNASQPGAPRINVAVGTRACAKSAEASEAAPLLCVLLPRSAFESIAAGAAKERALSALLIDQPPARQLAFVRIALPHARALALLLGPQSTPVEPPLLSAAAANGLHLVSAAVARPEEIYRALQGLLAAADVLLAVPDAVVFNSSTAQNILRTAYHHRVPIVAFSPSYVQAGAAMALYSTPEQIGKQAGRWVRGFLEGVPLPQAQSPREFSIAVNERVARGLGLNLENEAVLEERLRKLERGR